MKIRLGFLFIAVTAALAAQPVAVRHTQGVIHGFLALRTLDGDLLASGDLTQVATGDRVTAELVFRFKDGSLHDETSTFSQHGTFRLLSYRLVQKGPTFKRQTDLTLNAATGQVTVRYSDDGKEKVVTDQLKLPEELANGIVSTLVSALDPKTPKTTLALVASTPKPRLVKLGIYPDGDDSFSAGGQMLKATRYVVKVEIGGVTGAIAPIVGKQPPDTHIWVLGGKAPVFLKSEGPLFEDGPIWRIELASPVWPRGSSGDRP
jgi:hypothetical protein